MTPQLSIDVIDALEASHRDFEAAARGFSDGTALRKPAPERWSVTDCIEHMCTAESLGLQRLQSAEVATEASLNAEKEAALTAKVEDRSAKIQGPPAAMPKGRFATLPAALAEFAAVRSRTIEFVKASPNLTALRVTHPVLGSLTGREYALVIASHCRRHTAQIAEIRAALS